MNPNQTEADYLNLPTEKLPKMLNVLTILTFIGCGLGAVWTLITPWLMKFSAEMMDKASQSGNVSAKDMAEMEKGRVAIDAVNANLMPLLAIGAVGIILCFAGALMMRKLKKDGFWIYVAGQIIPLIGNIALLGMAQFTGVTSYLWPLIPIVFIVLYASQRKYLVR